jgi:hypothetical protein
MYNTAKVTSMRVVRRRDDAVAANAATTRRRFDGSNTARCTGAGRVGFSAGLASAVTVTAMVVWLAVGTLWSRVRRVC